MGPAGRRRFGLQISHTGRFQRRDRCRVPLFGYPKIDLNPGGSPFGGNEPPLGSSLPWGSQKAELWTGVGARRRLSQTKD